MFTYKLIKTENEIKYYEFYPEGNLDAPGIVSFDEKGQPSPVQDSKVDEDRYYMHRALWRIDTKKEQGTVAWC